VKDNFLPAPCEVCGEENGRFRLSIEVVDGVFPVRFRLCDKCTAAVRTTLRERRVEESK
jgi:hypothetical protein